MARENFLTNLIRGSKFMSAFQHARGYKPSIIGIPRGIVTKELLNDHIVRESAR